MQLPHQQHTVPVSPLRSSQSHVSLQKIELLWSILYINARPVLVTYTAELHSTYTDSQYDHSGF